MRSPPMPNESLVAKEYPVFSRMSARSSYNNRQRFRNCKKKSVRYYKQVKKAFIHNLQFLWKGKIGPSLLVKSVASMKSVHPEDRGNPSTLPMVGFGKKKVVRREEKRKVK